MRRAVLAGDGQAFCAMCGVDHAAGLQQRDIREGIRRWTDFVIRRGTREGIRG